MQISSDRPGEGRLAQAQSTQGRSTLYTCTNVVSIILNRSSELAELALAHYTGNYHDYLLAISE